MIIIFKIIFQKDNNVNMKLSMIKTNLPFFKINLYSPKNNLVLEQSPTITLEASTGELETGSKIASNGNIYVYLTQKGREAYWSLASMSEITLKVTNGGDTYEVKYYVLDYPIKMPSSIEYCSTGPIPNIINKQDIYIRLYILFLFYIIFFFHFFFFVILIFIILS